MSLLEPETNRRAIAVSDRIGTRHEVFDEETRERYRNQLQIQMDEVRNIHNAEEERKNERSSDLDRSFPSENTICARELRFDIHSISAKPEKLSFNLIPTFFPEAITYNKDSDFTIPVIFLGIIILLLGIVSITLDKVLYDVSKCYVSSNLGLLQIGVSQIISGTAMIIGGTFYSYIFLGTSVVVYTIPFVLSAVTFFSCLLQFLKEDQCSKMPSSCLVLPLWTLLSFTIAHAVVIKGGGLAWIIKGYQTATDRATNDACPKALNA